jgi:hypothetical protein
MAAFKKQSDDCKAKLAVYRKIVAEKNYIDILRAEEAKAKLPNPDSFENERPTLVKKIQSLETALSDAREEGQFLKQIAPVKAILKAASCRSLLNGVKTAFKTILGVKQVNFFFLDTETIELFRSDGFQLELFKVQNLPFYMAKY